MTRNCLAPLSLSHGCRELEENTGAATLSSLNPFAGGFNLIVLEGILVHARLAQPKRWHLEGLFSWVDSAPTLQVLRPFLTRRPVPHLHRKASSYPQTESIRALLRAYGLGCVGTAKPGISGFHASVETNLHHLKAEGVPVRGYRKSYLPQEPEN